MPRLAEQAVPADTVDPETGYQQALIKALARTRPRTRAGKPVGFTPHKGFTPQVRPSPTVGYTPDSAFD